MLKPGAGLDSPATCAARGCWAALAALRAYRRALTTPYFNRQDLAESLEQRRLHGAGRIPAQQHPR